MMRAPLRFGLVFLICCGACGGGKESKPAQPAAKPAEAKPAEGEPGAAAPADGAAQPAADAAAGGGANAAAPAGEGGATPAAASTGDQPADAKTADAKPADAKAGEGDGKPAEAAADAPSNGPVALLADASGGNYTKAATALKEVLAGTVDVTVTEGAGSFANIEQIGTGKAKYGIAQWDTVGLYSGMGGDKQAAAANCAIVAPMSDEFVHIVVRKKAKIKQPKQLAGKKIAVGPEHSGTWISAWNVMHYLANTNIHEPSENILTLPHEEALAKLIAGEIDAMFITAPAGQPALTGVAKKDAKQLVLLELPKKVKLPKELEPVYRFDDVPKKTYPFQAKKTRTLVATTYLIANRQESPESVSAFAKALYEKAATLREKDGGLWAKLADDTVKADRKLNLPYHEGVLSALAIE